MLCPNEKAEMRPVRVESHYGQSVLLDQCPECGGIWFDISELYMVKKGEAAKIELLNEDILRKPTAIENAEIVCPRDHEKLFRFTDPFFPKDIIIERCSKCSGVWLNRGEFTKYQHFRQERWNKCEKSSADLKLKQNIQAVLDENTSGDNVAVLGKLGKFLSTPLDNTTGRPLEPDRLSEGEQNTINMILNALVLILRIFIRI
jgi:Zn-finger nucleic acid-binding protein